MAKRPVKNGKPKGPCIGEKMGMNERPTMVAVAVKNGSKRTRGK